MIRMALVFVFVGAALLGYGAKEETRALKGEIEALAAEKAGIEAEIALLKAEWDYVSSDAFLTETAARLYGSDAAQDAEGARLAPWRPDQAYALDQPPVSPLEPAADPRLALAVRAHDPIAAGAYRTYSTRPAAAVRSVIGQVAR